MKMKLHAELIFIRKVRTYTRFETEAQENSEMAYLPRFQDALPDHLQVQSSRCCFPRASLSLGRH